MTIKAMIVDDEPFARQDLRHMLAQHPEIHVSWEAAKMDEAQNLLATHCPDVVFLDIELRGGLGFELVAHLNLQKTKIVFVTGHAAYSEQAFEYGAIDCLTKPVASGSLTRSLEKLKHALAIRDG